jgi:hypothetical protein
MRKAWASPRHLDTQVELRLRVATRTYGYWRADSTAEKNTRGMLKSGTRALPHVAVACSQLVALPSSAVDHALNADTIVLFDSLNYIKGYRYELYCIARSQSTPHCVVRCAVRLKRIARTSTGLGTSGQGFCCQTERRQS